MYSISTDSCTGKSTSTNTSRCAVHVAGQVHAHYKYAQVQEHSTR